MAIGDTGVRCIDGVVVDVRLVGVTSFILTYVLVLFESDNEYQMTDGGGYFIQIYKYRYLLRCVHRRRQLNIVNIRIIDMVFRCRCSCFAGAVLAILCDDIVVVRW